MTTDKNKQFVFEIYKQLKNNDFLDFKQKRSILETTIGAVNENSWRVIGITKECLKRFESLNFKYKSKQGINRSHIKQRMQTFVEIFEHNFETPNELWSYYYDRDETVLSTSTENMTEQMSEIIPIDTTLGFFKSNKVGWKHNIPERIFLEQLYNETI